MRSTPRVLCVDDDPDACEMLRELLKISGIRSQTAHSGEEAWRMMSTQRFDLYLLDAWLPDVDGFEICRRIRTVDRETPILFYSGAAYDRDRQRGIEAGANAYLVKPEVEGLIDALLGLIVEADKAKLKPRTTAMANLIEANRRAALFETSFATRGSFI